MSISTEIPDNAKFCPYCGNPISEIAENSYKHDDDEIEKTGGIDSASSDLKTTPDLNVAIKIN